MTDPIPEPTELETVARLAAEAVVRALPESPEQRIADLERSVQEILQALTAAASPEGNAARLSSRIADVEQGLARLSTPPPNPEQQLLIDDLRQRLATLERTRH